MPVVTETAIRAEGLTKRFGEIDALAGIDLSVPAGTVYGLLGPNGAVKTTTVRILTTILRPDGGRAEVLGLDVTRHPQTVRESIGLAGQYAAIDENLTGRENLKLVGGLTHLPASDVTGRADELLERFGLTDPANRDLHKGLIERFRSLPMAGSAVLAGRTIADATRNAFVMVLMTAVGFLVGFRIHGGIAAYVGALALILLSSPMRSLGRRRRSGSGRPTARPRRRPCSRWCSRWSSLRLPSSTRRSCPAGCRRSPIISPCRSPSTPPATWCWAHRWAGRWSARSPGRWASWPCSARWPCAVTAGRRDPVDQPEIPAGVKRPHVSSGRAPPGGRSTRQWWSSVEAERWVLVGEQQEVGVETRGPADDAHHERAQTVGPPTREQHREERDDHRHECRETEHGQHDHVRDHQDDAERHRETVAVLELGDERSSHRRVGAGVARHRLEDERRILLAQETCIRPGAVVVADVQALQGREALGQLAGDQDEEPADDPDHLGHDPQDVHDDEMRDGQQPLNERPPVVDALRCIDLERGGVAAQRARRRSHVLHVPSLVEHEVGVTLLLAPPAGRDAKGACRSARSCSTAPIRARDRPATTSPGTSRSASASWGAWCKRAGTRHSAMTTRWNGGPIAPAKGAWL